MKHTIIDRVIEITDMFPRPPPSSISIIRLAMIIGIDIKNEYVALSFTLHILAVAIVLPLLLIPGMQAIA